MQATAPTVAGEISHASTLGTALAFTAGYVDTLGFIALFGLFTAHVTGNFVLIGSELANPSHGVLIKLLAFPAFILGVVAARFVVIYSERLRRAAAPVLLAAQALLLVGFMAAGWAALPLTDSRAPMTLAAGVLGAVAMGIQNAASKLVWGSLSPTTVMTGNVTQLVIDFVDVFRVGATPELRHRIQKFLWPVIAFGTGAILGAFAFRYFSFLALVLPIGIVVGVVPLCTHATPHPTVGSPQH